MAGVRRASDREVDARQTAKRLATVTALPVSRPTGNGGTVAEVTSATAGEVMPARGNTIGKTRRGRKRIACLLAHFFESRGYGAYG